MLRAAPEIFQIRIADLDPGIVPVGAAPGRPEFEGAGAPPGGGEIGPQNPAALFGLAQGLEINDPDQRYRLNSLEGDGSGLQLLCLMHAGIWLLDPQANTGTGLDKEYDMAFGMRGGT